MYIQFTLSPGLPSTIQQSGTEPLITINNANTFPVMKWLPFILVFIDRVQWFPFMTCTCIYSCCPKSEKAGKWQHIIPGVLLKRFGHPKAQQATCLLYLFPNFILVLYIICSLCWSIHPAKWFSAKLNVKLLLIIIGLVLRNSWLSFGEFSKD